MMAFNKNTFKLNYETIGLWQNIIVMNYKYRSDWTNIPEAKMRWWIQEKQRVISKDKVKSTETCHNIDMLQRFRISKDYGNSRNNWLHVHKLDYTYIPPKDRFFREYIGIVFCWLQNTWMKKTMWVINLKAFTSSSEYKLLSNLYLKYPLIILSSMYL